MSSRVQCKIDLQQLRNNFEYIKRCAGSCRLMPVLKYDAYGLGANAVGRALKAAGAFRFAVADINEAVKLLPLGLDVQVLGILPEFEIAEAVASGVICPVCQLETARQLSREAVRRNRTVRIAIKLDTGMGRIGFNPEQDAEIIREITGMPNLIPDGLFSHFSTAAEPDAEYAAWQIGRFKQLLQMLVKAGITFPNIHHAAGDAIVKLPEATKPPFNLARPGGIMYGEDFNSPCRQIITLAARVGSVRLIPRGGSVGYFRKFRAEKDTPVAVITAGYADGIPLALSNRGSVLIGGVHCPILGRISMDYTVVDISGTSGDVKVGDEVILLGRQQDAEITVRQWGEYKNTHSHDIWCAIGHRVERVYGE